MIRDLPCLLLAQSGHRAMSDVSPLSEAKRTCRERPVMSANDPKRRLTAGTVGVRAGTA